MSHAHRTAELRSIELHRVIAERLDDPDVLEKARARVEQWVREGGPVHPIWASRWQEILSRPVPEIADALVADTEEMRDLRQVTPFAGVVSPRERWRIVREVR